MAASSLKASKTYLEAQFRRLRARRGPAIGVKAMAAKLARLVYNMLRHGMEYVDRETDFYEQQQHERRLHTQECRRSSDSNWCRWLPSPTENTGADYRSF